MRWRVDLLWLGMDILGVWGDVVKGEVAVASYVGSSGSVG